MEQDLTGKSALVTGGGRGIGRAIAENLGARGARVAVHYGSNADAARETVERIEAGGGAAVAIAAELGTTGDAETLWTEYDAHFDGDDILINNAGILGGRLPFQDVTVDAFDLVHAVNARAPFFVTQRGLPRLRDGGRIVNISTRFTHGSYNPSLLPYAMSKAAVDALTYALAKELAPRSITVNAVGPGGTATEMNAARLATEEGRAAMAADSPLGRIGQPADVAGIVGFLVSDAAAWVTGQWIDASGGSLL
ncbi:SDR family oxidoreductase [Nocardiopsis tropica]